MRAVIRVFVLTAFCSGLAVWGSGIAEAQSRDRALASVLTLTEQLIERTGNGTASDDKVFAGVQALTDAMRRFVLSETEIRSGAKVGPPADSSLRPGELEKVPSQQPGPEVSLSMVPTPWFNQQASRSQEALDLVRDGVEQAVPRPELVDRLQKVLDAVKDINRPPA